MASVAAAVVGCDVGRGPDAAPDAPVVLWSIPADGDEGASRRTGFRVGMDRQLRSRTVNRATVRLVSGPARAFLSVWFDPVQEAIVAAGFRDDPLVSGVTYRILIDGVRDLEDRPMVQPFVARFRTGTALGEPADPPVVTWQDVASIFDGSCTGLACHGPGEPALGLDLSSPEAVRATALGVTSRQLPGATGGAQSARGGLSLVGLPLIDVVAGEGRPSNSYLLFKALGDPHVLGEPMPPPSDRAHAPLGADDLGTLAGWIRSGAATE